MAAAVAKAKEDGVNHFKILGQWWKEIDPEERVKYISCIEWLRDIFIYQNGSLPKILFSTDGFWVKVDFALDLASVNRKKVSVEKEIYGSEPGGMLLDIKILTTK